MHSRLKIINIIRKGIIVNENKQTSNRYRYQSGNLKAERKRERQRERERERERERVREGLVEMTDIEGERER